MSPTVEFESSPFSGPGADRTIAIPSPGWQVDDLILYVSAGQRIGGIADYNSLTADGNAMTQEVSFQSDTSGGTTRSLRVWLYWWRATYAASGGNVVADHPLSAGLGAAEAKVLVVRGAKATGNPFTTATASDNSASTTIQFPTVSAQAGSLVLQLLCHGESSGSADTPGVVSGAAGFSNTDLTNFTCLEYKADPDTSNEQVVALLSGEAPSGGTVGNTTATSADSTAAESTLTFAITPGLVLPTCEADPFTRADNASSMGSTPAGRLWTPLNTSGTFAVGINSNHAYCSDDAPGGKVVIDLENAEHDVKVKPFGFVAGTHFAPAVLFRHHPTGHAHYALLAFTGTGANNHPQLFKFDSSNNGTLVQAWAGVTWASGDELRARAHGDLVDIYLAGSLVEADVALDSGYAGYTRAGIRFEQISGTSQYYDDWEACPVISTRWYAGRIVV